MQWPPAASAAELLAYDDEHLDPGLGELSHCGCLVALVGDDDAWLERDDVVAVVPLFPLRLELVAAGRDELQVGDPECALDLLEESALGDLRLYAGVAAGAGQERPNLRGDRLVERGDVAVAEAEDRVERTRLGACGSAVLRLVDRGRAEQCQSEVRHTLENALELGLVTHVTEQHGRPVLAGESHAVERTTDSIAELSLESNPVLPTCHTVSIARLALQRAAAPHDHIGDSACSSRPSASARATASTRELTPSLR
jgi:hypothetical protein